MFSASPNSREDIAIKSSIPPQRAIFLNANVYFSSIGCRLNILDKTITHFLLFYNNSCKEDCIDPIRRMESMNGFQILSSAIHFSVAFPDPRMMVRIANITSATPNQRLIAPKYMPAIIAIALAKLINRNE